MPESGTVPLTDGTGACRAFALIVSEEPVVVVRVSSSVSRLCIGGGACDCEIGCDAWNGGGCEEDASGW